MNTKPKLKQKFLSIDLLSNTELDAILQNNFKHYLKEFSIKYLLKKFPHFSATNLTNVWFFYLLAFVVISLTGSIIVPEVFLPLLLFTINSCYFLTWFFKIILLAKGYSSKFEKIKIEDEELPIYTIFVALYKEENVVKQLINNLEKIDYPRYKLDIKLIIEEDDIDTKKALLKLNLTAPYSIIVVPNMKPKTKGKALNYALPMAYGKYVVVYDAEDLPDPKQLKLAVQLFKNSPKQVICVQGKLNFYNENENFLTKMLSLEYNIWFNYLLKGLNKYDIAFPLGGTSNHFKTRKLIEIGGWDAYNVTEDAELGIRIYACGYQSRLFNSNTQEEAPISLIAWLKQRARWIKGHFQTYLTFMLHPSELRQTIGYKSFLSLHLFIGLSCFSYIINIFIYISWLLVYLSKVKMLMFSIIKIIAIVNILTTVTYNTMIIIIRAKDNKIFSLLPLVTPFYWLLHSIAGGMALWQLLFNPYHWDKTKHGVSKQV